MNVRLFLLWLCYISGNCFQLNQLPMQRHSFRLRMGQRSFGSKVVTVDNTRIDFTNFWRRSIANFSACERPVREPDYASWSGSLYWDQGDHLVRLSDHWTGQFGVGPIRECRWYLMQNRTIPNLDVAAKCNYDEFRMIKKKSMKKRKKWSKRKA